MKLTAPVPVPDREVSKEQVAAWANDEARPLLRQLRQFANYLSAERHVSEASDGASTYLRLWESPAMPTDGCWLISASIAGTHVSGAAQAMGYETKLCVQSVAGTLTDVGSLNTVEFESAVDIKVRVVIDATNRKVAFEARDDGVSPMRFTTVVTTNEVTP